MKQKFIIEIISFLLILLFVYTAFSKLFNYADFESQLRLSPHLKGISGIIAMALPATEIITAALLIIHNTRRTGFLLSVILMSSFTIYVAAVLHFEKNLPCSCGGVIEEMSWGQHLVFNIFFLALAVLGWRMETKNNRSHKPLAY